MSATPDRVSVERAAMVEVLSCFVRAAWSTIEPAPLQWNWHMEAICDHVQAQHQGKTQNLVINVPPGSTKSLIVSVLLPAWIWLRRPEWRGLFASANPRVALRDSMRCRELLESEWYARTFSPRWRLADDQNAKSYYANTAGGSRLAISTDSRVTGERVHGIVVDDPLDAQDAPSRAARDGVVYAWDRGLANRLADPQTGTRTIIMQRLHEEDLAGHVLDEGGWSHLRIPMEFDAKASCLCDDCKRGETFIRWRDPREKDGELMFPSRFTPAVLEQERRRLGPSGYAGQMQQRPTPEGGAMFRRDHFRYVATRPDNAIARVRSWDLAASSDGDWTVGVLMSRTADMRYVIEDVVRFRGSPGEVERRMLATAQADGPSVKIRIPKDPGQAGVAQSEALTRLLGGYVVTAEAESGDKVVRASPFASQVEGGNVSLIAGAPWVPEYLAEVEAFPRAKWDDQVDGSSGAFNALPSQSRPVLDGVQVVRPSAWAGRVR